MRQMLFLAVLALAGCAVTPTSTTTSTTLNPADAATSLMVGGPVTLTTTTPTAAAQNGEDPAIVITLARADGRTMSFEQANHAPYDLAVQTPGGPLAQTMGLMQGQEQPVYYHARAGADGAAFICGAAGPQNLGIYTAPDGAVTVYGLSSGFQVESGANGAMDVAPFSPDHICARLHFTKS